MRSGSYCSGKTASSIRGSCAAATRVSGSASTDSSVLLTPGTPPILPVRSVPEPAAGSGCGPVRLSWRPTWRPGGTEPRERVRLALTVLLTAMSGARLSSELPGGPDDLVADAIDNLRFGAEDAVPAEDLAFVNLARVRELMNEGAAGVAVPGQLARRRAGSRGFPARSAPAVMVSWIGCRPES
jgi:hypothetical protein